MVWWLFNANQKVKLVEEDTKKGFDAVKKDIFSMGKWIKHLDDERDFQKKSIEELKGDLSTIKEELREVKNLISFISEIKNFDIPKKNRLSFNKQTAVYGVQTDVQTDVQTVNLDRFSLTERAIIWILLNNEMRLSYNDLAAILGKDGSTIRGQINHIKQKNENLIGEIIEENGKKRVFIPERIKEKLLKKQKVRIEKDKKTFKN